MKTINVSDKLHQQLKILSAMTKKDMQEIVDVALKEHLTRKSKKVK